MLLRGVEAKKQVRVEKEKEKEKPMKSDISKSDVNSTKDIVVPTFRRGKMR
jgi:hypothetical protein